jgi:hypothetical protein
LLAESAKVKSRKASSSSKNPFISAALALFIFKMTYLNEVYLVFDNKLPRIKNQDYFAGKYSARIPHKFRTNVVESNKVI